MSYNKDIMTATDYQEIINDKSRWGELNSLSRQTWTDISASCNFNNKDFLLEYGEELNWVPILLTKKVDKGIVKELFPSVLLRITLDNRSNSELLKVLYKQYSENEPMDMERAKDYYYDF